MNRVQLQFGQANLMFAQQRLQQATGNRQQATGQIFLQGVARLIDNKAADTSLR